MAAATLASNKSGQGIIKVFSFTAVGSGSTFAYSGPVKSWVGVNKTTADALSVSFSSGTFTFTVANTPDCDLWVIL